MSLIISLVISLFLFAKNIFFLSKTKSIFFSSTYSPIIGVIFSKNFSNALIFLILKSLINFSLSFRKDAISFLKSNILFLSCSFERTFFCLFISSSTFLSAFSFFSNFFKAVSLETFNLSMIDFPALVFLTILFKSI